MGLFQKFQRLPVHWKCLLGGQAVVTMGIMSYRIATMSSITARKNAIEKKNAAAAAAVTPPTPSS
jgi:hypothetical protein